MTTSRCFYLFLVITSVPFLSLNANETPYIPIHGSAWQIAVVDADGDGRNELFYATFQGQVGGVNPRSGRHLWKAPLGGFPFDLEAADLDAGVACMVGCADGGLILELAHHSQFMILALDPDPANVAKTKQRMADAGVLGRGVYVAQGTKEQIPFADNDVDLLVLTGGQPNDLDEETRREIMRVITPVRGRAIIGHFPWSGSLRGQ